MSYKIVRDKNEAWCREHGVPGQWRRSPDPVSALYRKIGEEYGECVENRDPAELYDLLDVVLRLIDLVDPVGRVGYEHHRKVTEMGGFENLVEWCPVPEGMGDDE